MLYHARQVERCDGTRPRQVSARTTLEYYSPLLTMLRTRHLYRDYRDLPFIPPNLDGAAALLPAPFTAANAATTYATRFVKDVRDQNQRIAHAVAFEPRGRHVFTGYESGQIALWNTTLFNFYVTTDCHTSAVRCLQWAHSGRWLLSGDLSGGIKYLEYSLRAVHEINPDVEHGTYAVRDFAFAPTDQKYVAAIGNGDLSLYDFERRTLEHKFAAAHNSDATAVAWHPSQGLLLSSSTDSTVKLWDPRSKLMVASLGNTAGVLKARWNDNGHWFATGSIDRTVRTWDVRSLRPMTVHGGQNGHRGAITALTWHPHTEDLLTTADDKGDIIHWSAHNAQPEASINQAHTNGVTDLDWHPLGHLLCSSSLDKKIKFWGQNLPGDSMRDAFNLMQLEAAHRREAHLEQEAALRQPHNAAAHLLEKYTVQNPATAAGVETAAASGGISGGFGGGIPGVGVNIPGVGVGVSIGIPGIGGNAPVPDASAGSGSGPFPGHPMQGQHGQQQQQRPDYRNMPPPASLTAHQGGMGSTGPGGYGMGSGGGGYGNPRRARDDRDREPAGGDREQHGFRDRSDRDGPSGGAPRGHFGAGPSPHYGSGSSFGSNAGPGFGPGFGAGAGAGAGGMMPPTPPPPPPHLINNAAGAHMAGSGYAPPPHMGMGAPAAAAAAGAGLPPPPPPGWQQQQGHQGQQGQQYNSNMRPPMPPAMHSAHGQFTGGQGPHVPPPLPYQHQQQQQQQGYGPGPGPGAGAATLHHQQHQQQQGQRYQGQQPHQQGQQQQQQQQPRSGGQGYYQGRR